MATAFKIFRWAFIYLFAIILILKIYLRASSVSAMGSNETLIILGFVAVLLLRNKLTWVFGLLLFIGGLYNLFFIAYKAAEPTAMQFTHPIIQALFANSYSSTAAKIIGTIPDFFCIVGLLFFITPHVRRLYWYKL